MLWYSPGNINIISLKAKVENNMWMVPIVSLDTEVLNNISQCNIGGYLQQVNPLTRSEPLKQKRHLDNKKLYFLGFENFQTAKNKIKGLFHVFPAQKPFLGP